MFQTVPGPAARATGWCVAVGLLLLGACSSPPRSTATDPALAETSAPAEGDSATIEDPYDFEREGNFPAPPPDVEFEEDELPPRPEEVESAPVDPGVVEPTELGEDLPPRPDEEVEAPVAELPTVETPVPGQSVPMRMGFRVQLLAAAERVEAERFAREVRSRLGEVVHIDFEAPYYKVRAGDFVDRADALVLRDRARASGYDGAWVVSTRVRVSPDEGS